MRLKDGFASGIGSILEWYDFALYGYFSTTIAQLFFPSDDGTLGLLKVFIVYAIGFIARPIGAVIFGTLSDKKGRSKGLKLTPPLIALPTFLFSIIPTYKYIGIGAPISLVLIRICQGICIGGEYSNNINYLCESSNNQWTYFMGSIGSCCASAGIMLSALTAFLLTYFLDKNALLSYGWRIGFFLSTCIALIAFALRWNINETTHYKILEKKHSLSKRPLLTSLKNHKNEYFLALSISLLPATAFYFVFTFLPSYLVNTIKLGNSKILGESSLSLCVRLLIIPIIGLIADRVGGLRIARTSAFLFAILSYPLMATISHEPAHASTCLLIFFILTTLNAGTTPGLLMKILPTPLRCTMLSLTLNISFGIFGGLTPLLCLELSTHSKSYPLAPIYIITTAIITLISTFFYERYASYEENIRSN